MNLFSGCGGWEEGARLLTDALARDIRGVEIMPEAIATARAAGHEVVEMSAADPIPADWVATGLIASPPCQAFSAAGKRLGKHDLPIIAQAIEWVVENAATVDLHAPLPAHFAEACEDPRSILVVEPLRWVLALRPEWVAFEQVPAVLPLWEEFAEILDLVGYSTWVGKLSSEEYGVPQTRVRAFLVASRVRPVGTPPPTHQGYDRRGKAPTRGTEHRAPYVTMAQALGWADDALVGFPRRADELESVEIDGEAYCARDFREGAAPAFNLTGKARSWHVVGNNSIAGGPLAERGDDEPAMTVGSRADLWKMRPNALPNATERAGHDSGERRWVYDRPATTVAGDPRISAPGWRGAPRDYAADGTYTGERSMDRAERVSVAQAAVLQSFPADYPLQGARTKQFLQVGNAVPPRFAAHVLAVATGLEPPGPGDTIIP